MESSSKFTIEVTSAAHRRGRMTTRTGDGRKDNAIYKMRQARMTDGTEFQAITWAECLKVSQRKAINYTYQDEDRDFARLKHLH